MFPTLEKYRGAKSRHTCPACHTRNCFVRYIGDGGEYFASDVGRCNRESKCGYHKKPKEFFADHQATNTGGGGQPANRKKRTVPNYGFAGKNGSQVGYQFSGAVTNKPDYIPFERFKPTLGNYDCNAFVQFLLNLFPDCAEEIQSILKMYFVGTYEDYTCFPSIDRLNRICRAKLIRFNQTTGKRLKGEFDTSSLPAKLKLKEAFQYKQIFFGEHLLPKFPHKPIAIVEAEKTAIIASLCFPEFVWLGSNSKTWLKAERLQRIVQHNIILYPDADSFTHWQQQAQGARLQGLTVKVSNLIELHATVLQKANGYDLADYLINQQNETNAFNKFADDYNARLEMVLRDEDLTVQFNSILDEQKSVMMIDGNLSEMEAENLLADPVNIRRTVMSL